MAMKIQQQFKLNGFPDPFTLLKVSQAFREIACDDALEFICTGERFPDELLKVLPTGEYEIAVQDQYENPVRCRIVLRKTGTADIGNGPDTGCQCS
jgi:TusA-related sulfurtransferase